MTGVTFQTERPVFLREQANKMYDVVPYYLSKILSELPSFIVPPIIGTVITFFSFGFTREDGNFFKFALNAICTALCAISYGYLISTGVTNPEAAM